MRLVTKLRTIIGESCKSWTVASLLQVLMRKFMPTKLLIMMLIWVVLIVIINKSLSPQIVSLQIHIKPNVEMLCVVIWRIKDALLLTLAAILDLSLYFRLEWLEPRKMYKLDISKLFALNALTLLEALNSLTIGEFSKSWIAQLLRWWIIIMQIRRLIMLNQTHQRR